MKSYKIALDIGATKILAGLVINDKVIKTVKKPTKSKSDKKIILKNIERIISDLWIKNVKQIGIGIAGQIDYKNGVVLSTGNFNPKFKNIKLAEILKNKFRVDVKIDNDVKCFALAEQKYGWGRNYKDFITLTFGTGIGGAIIIDKKILRGKNNLAGEVGHHKITGSWIGPAPICGCGQKYCWETLASGRAWEKIAKKTTSKKADLIIIPNIAVGLNNLAVLFNPECFIISGGLLEHPKMLDKIRKEFKSRAFHPLIKETKIFKPKLGSEAILLGSLISS